MTVSFESCLQACILFPYFNCLYLEWLWSCVITSRISVMKKRWGYPDWSKNPTLSEVLPVDRERLEALGGPSTWFLEERWNQDSRRDICTSSEHEAILPKTKVYRENVYLTYPFFSFLESNCPHSGGVPILSQIKHIRIRFEKQRLFILYIMLIYLDMTLKGEVLTRESSVLS